jgi:hypothetical protein
MSLPYYNKVKWLKNIQPLVTQEFDIKTIGLKEILETKAIGV